MPDYPNKNRTKQQRKARYCFLRHLGFNRDLTRQVVAYRDTRIIMFIENNSNLRGVECVDLRKNKITYQAEITRY